MESSPRPADENVPASPNSASSREEHRSHESRGFSGLCDEARNGSSQALGELLESSRNYLLLIANLALKGKIRGKVGPSDLVQETFIEAQRSFERFEGKSDEELQRWLYRILEHRIGNTFKRFLKTNRRDITREVDWSGLFLTLAEHDLPGNDPKTPGSLLSLKEDAGQFEIARAHLPSDQRQVIQLRVDERLSFEQIGLQMHRSTDAARKLFARAVLKLQTLLNQHHDRQPDQK